MKIAMKSGERLKLETLRTLRAHLVELTKRGSGKPVTPDDEIAAVMGEMKKRKEAIELYEKGGRLDLAEQETRELAILKAYLPAQMTAEEAAARVEQVIAETGSSSPRDLGKVMGILMKELKGRVDGKALQDIVRTKLGG